MRSGLLVVVAVCAACETRGGLQFEIDASADPDATEVRLYVGSGDGQGVVLAAEGQKPDPMHAGKFYPLVFGEEADIVALSGHTATVSFAPGGDVGRLTVVAVGLTKGERTSVATVTRAALRSDVIEVWNLVLEPAVANVGISSGRAVGWWGDDAGESTCVQAVDRSGTPENVFVGLPGDKDCDGYLAGTRAECTDQWHDAVQAAAHDTMSCVEQRMLAQPNGDVIDVCMVGSRVCTDGAPDQRVDCSHTVPYCAPQGLCEVCTDSDPEDRFRCAVELDPTQHAATIAFATCPILVNTAASPPKVCEQQLTATGPPDWIPTQITCGQALFHSDEARDPWLPSARIGNIEMVLGQGSALAACQITVTPRAIPNTAIQPSEFPAHGLLAIPLDNVGRTGVIAPIVFELEEVSGCPSPAPARDCIPTAMRSNDTAVACITRDANL